MLLGAVSIRGYEVISESRGTFAHKTYQVRDEDRSELLTLHLFPRPAKGGPDPLAIRAELPRYSALRVRQIVRPRRIRADDKFFLVETDRADGESLENILVRESQLDPASALRYVEDLLVGLVAGEMNGLYHGAIRPSCVVVDREGRAALDAFGFGALLPDAGDFYSKLATDVPITLDRRHAKDVYAVVALLHHLVEGRPPFKAEGSADEFLSRVVRERWEGFRFQEIYDAVSPLDRAEAGDVLRLIRSASAEVMAPEPAEPAPPSLLDAVDELPPPPATPKLGKARELLRRFTAGPTWPALAAGVIGALVALVFGAPFLGSDASLRQTIKSAVSLPSAAPLAPSTAPKSEPPVEKKIDAPAAPERRTEFEQLRQRVVALAEIGDYPAALDALGEATGWTPEQVSEERDAVIASARRRFDELKDLGRALTAENHLPEALREWEAMKALWPGGELLKRAEEEQAYLARESAELRRQKEDLDRHRALQKFRASFRGLVRRILFEDRYDYSKQLEEIEAFRKDAPPGYIGDVAASLETLKECVEREQAYYKLVQETVESRIVPMPITGITNRFGAGEIIELGEGTLMVKRPDSTLHRMPLTRLDFQEKRLLFYNVRRRNDGARALAFGLMCLGWGLPDQAKSEFRRAESSSEFSARFLESVRGLAEEE